MLRLAASLVFVTAPALALEPALPAGTYRLDPSHASLVFTVDHLGFSQYTAGFDRFDATLVIDPADPVSADLTAAVEVASLDLPSPPDDFLETMLSPAWLNAGRHPQITFVSDAIGLDGDDRAEVSGQVTFLGVTRPAVLSVRFNGGYAGHDMDPNARIGFSATGSLARSHFGLTIGVPPEGSTMGVGDMVDFRIEVEFVGPPWPQ